MLLSLPAVLALLSLSIFIFYSMIVHIRTAYFSPLACIPGPFLAKFTSASLKWHIIRGRRVQYVHEMHKIYGHFVRIAPNEIDIADIQVYRDIHRIGNGIEKSQWYQKFRTAYSDQDVFSETDPKKHSVRRKLLSRPFSNSNLKQNWSQLINEKAQLAVQKIKAQAEAGHCDVFEWWNYFAVDVIGQISFGESFGMLELGRKTEFIQMFENFAIIGILRAEFPLLYKLASKIPNSIYDIEKVEKVVIEYGRKIIGRTKLGSMNRRNIFTDFLVVGENGGEGEISKESIVTEATGLIGAGGGTTSVTLTYLVWAVLSNQKIQKRLEHEVSTLREDFSDQDIQALPYLNAVMEETLRLYGPVPGSLSRVVPIGGLQIFGHYVPGGTIVGTQSYSMHRHPEIYSEPESYDPNRFLQHNLIGHDQRSAFAAFGAGSRTCLGMHLAYMELRTAVALFFRECAGVRLALSSPDEMDMVNFFGGAPKNQSCNITLRAI